MIARDNPDEQRYELVRAGDVVGELAYRRTAGRVTLVHTEVEPSLQGLGLGSRLVAGSLDDIRSRAEAVIPVCSFVGAYIQRHPEHEDLVA